MICLRRSHVKPQRPRLCRGCGGEACHCEERNDEAILILSAYPGRSLCAWVARSDLFDRGPIEWSSPPGKHRQTSLSVPPGKRRLLLEYLGLERRRVSELRRLLREHAQPRVHEGLQVAGVDDLVQEEIAPGVPGRVGRGRAPGGREDREIRFVNDVVEIQIDISVRRGGRNGQDRRTTDGGFEDDASIPEEVHA